MINPSNMKKKVPFYFFLSLLTTGVGLFSCSDPSVTGHTYQPGTPERSCIDRVIAMDDSLATLRNHATETLSMGTAIRQYVNGMVRIPYNECPEAFMGAMSRHRQAWLDMITLVNEYPDLRGEMHALFDQVKQEQNGKKIEEQLVKIRDTWTEVTAFTETPDPAASEQD